MSIILDKAVIIIALIFLGLLIAVWILVIFTGASAILVNRIIEKYGSIQNFFDALSRAWNDFVRALNDAFNNFVRTILEVRT